jgi:hypothetical protein
MSPAAPDMQLCTSYTFNLSTIHSLYNASTYRMAERMPRCTAERESGRAGKVDQGGGQSALAVRSAGEGEISAMIAIQAEAIASSTRRSLNGTPRRKSWK